VQLPVKFSLKNEGGSFYMRLGNLLLVVILLVLLVIIVDPGARQKANALINKWNRELAVNPPSVSVNEPNETVATPVPTMTPLPTAVTDNDQGIPNTGGNETNERPIIQVNWDALNAALRRFWDSLRNIKINLNPATNR
jgi:hypothetical protein